MSRNRKPASSSRKAATKTNAIPQRPLVEPTPAGQGASVAPADARESSLPHEPALPAHDAGEQSMPLSLSPELRDRRRERSWHDFWNGLAITIVLIFLKLVIEGTSVGQDIKLMTYDSLHAQLPSVANAVVIADISNVPMDRCPTGDVCTSRSHLIELVRALYDSHPRAIGIDIDFSPEKNNFVDKDHDPQLFDLCLALSRDKSTGQQIPIYLGVYRSLDKQPAEWLKIAKYQELAANLIVPKTDNRVMPMWRQLNKKTKPLPSLGAALASAYLKKTLEHHESVGLRYPTWFAEASIEKHNSAFAVSEFLVDYRPIDYFVDQGRVQVTDRAGVESNRHRFADKIVLLGKASIDEVQENSFVPPGSRNAYPGIYFHACAANTLVENPLYELTAGGRVLADFFLSALIFGGLLGTGIYYSGRVPEKVNVPRLYITLTLIAILLTWIVGFVWIKQTGIIWDDFLLVMIALVIHPFVEPFIHWISTRWREFVTQADSEVHQ